MASTTCKRHRMRCNACRAAKRGSGRFTLKRHPNQYVHPVRCPTCGETIRVVSVEKDRQLELERRPSHTCEGYPFPHQPGSLRMCVEHPEYVLGFEPTEEEHDQHQAVLNTRRSGSDWGVPEEFDIEADDFEIPF